MAKSIAVLIDPSEDSRKSLCSWLNTHHFQCHAAARAEDVLPLVEYVEPDLVLISMNAREPFFNPCAIIAGIRTLPGTDHVLIIGYGKQDAEKVTMPPGSVVDYLFEKPFDLVQLDGLA